MEEYLVFVEYPGTGNWQLVYRTIFLWDAEEFVRKRMENVLEMFTDWPERAPNHYIFEAGNVFNGHDTIVALRKKK